MDPGLVTLPSSFSFPRRKWEGLHAATPGALREATSTVLVRDGSGGLEVFLQHRVAEMAFAAGMTVFPGGGVDDRDRSRVVGSAARWAQVWGTDEASASALVVAAVREVFEETGVLLAGPDPDTVADAATVAGLAADRAALAHGSADLAGVLEGAGLVPRDDLLVPWARWVTPELLPRRFDTRFFVAVVPAGQEADGDTSEAVEASWTTPAAALRDWAEGTRQLMPPTWAVLGDLAEHADTAALRASALDRRPTPVTPTFVPGDEHVALAVPATALAGAHR